MALRWTRLAFADLKRIHAFLEPVDPAVAAKSVRAIVRRVRRIPVQPRLGEPLSGFRDREVRRVLIESYEVRYELADKNIYILRIFHTREDR